MKRMRIVAAMMVLAGAAAPAAAQEFGRLFFTAEQRQQLDARRKARVPDKPAAAVVAAPTTRIDGFVRRSGGPTTVFVNGESLTESAQAESPRVGRDASVSLPVSESGARVAMKPGETLDRGSGEVRDVLGGGELKVRRPPGK